MAKTKKIRLGFGHFAKPEGACEWFLTCCEPAVEAVPHPVLGEVPACARCAKFAKGKKDCA